MFSKDIEQICYNELDSESEPKEHFMLVNLLRKKALH